jgi:DNA-directed RNA polymerase omega subunit
MEEVSLEHLLTKEESLFKLTNMAAIRAMEINSGMKKLVDAPHNAKATSIAIKEIANDKVRIKKDKK